MASLISSREAVKTRDKNRSSQGDLYFARKMMYVMNPFVSARRPYLAVEG